MIKPERFIYAMKYLLKLRDEPKKMALFIRLNREYFPTITDFQLYDLDQQESKRVISMPVKRLFKD